MKRMNSRLGDCRLYKIDVPSSESGVGVILVSFGGFLTSERFQLRQNTKGRRRGRAGLSKSFVSLVDNCFFVPEDLILTGQIFDYIESNFSFKDLDVVPPACPVLVFHFNTTAFGKGHVPEIDDTGFSRTVLSELKIADSVPTVDEDAIIKGRVPIDPPVTVILDCYQSEDLCSLCQKGYPKEDEIVHKTKCNHIFHGTCISRHLLRIPQCPVCSTDLPPVDIRTLLFS